MLSFPNIFRDTKYFKEAELKACLPQFVVSSDFLSLWFPGFLRFPQFVVSVGISEYLLPVEKISDTMFQFDIYFIKKIIVKNKYTSKNQAPKPLQIKHYKMISFQLYYQSWKI